MFYKNRLNWSPLHTLLVVVGRVQGKNDLRTDTMLDAVEAATSAGVKLAHPGDMSDPFLTTLPLYHSMVLIVPEGYKAPLG